MEKKQLNLCVDADIYEKIKRYAERFDLSTRKAVNSLIRGSDETQYVARSVIASRESSVTSKIKLTEVAWTAWKKDRSGGGACPHSAQNGGLDRAEAIAKFEETYEVPDSLRERVDANLSAMRKFIGRKILVPINGIMPTRDDVDAIPDPKPNFLGLTGDEMEMLEDEMRGCLESDDCHPDPFEELSAYLAEKLRRWPGNELIERQAHEIRDRILAERE